MDGMTINHIASIDHGSYEAQIFIFGVCRATGAGSALGCALRSCRWSTELRKAFEDDQLWQDGCGGLGGGIMKGIKFVQEWSIGIDDNQ